MNRAQESFFWALPLFILTGLLAITLFVDSPLLVAPIAAFLWLLVAKEKGYLSIGLALFIVTGVIFTIQPVFWTGFAMVGSLVALSCVPARKKEEGRWRIASKNGDLKSWLLPHNSQADIGAIVGDASIHIIAITFLLALIILL